MAPLRLVHESRAAHAWLPHGLLGTLPWPRTSPLNWTVGQNGRRYAGIVLRPLLAPRLLGLHALAIVATTAAVLLGVWQYGAWQIHREDKAASLANAAPRPLQSVMLSDDPFPGRDIG